MESDPRPDQVDEDEADRRRYGSRYQEIGDRPPTNTADLADVAEAGDAERQRSEHEGHDRHQEHPQEDLATGPATLLPTHCTFSAARSAGMPIHATQAAPVANAL